jgi:hydrogenase maturation protease
MKKDKNTTLVIGLGNPILSDDGVGCHVAAALKERLPEMEADILETSVAGLDFLDLMTGYDRVIMIDAIQTVAGTPGQVYRLDLEAFKATRHAASPHDVNLATALELGYKLDLDLPSHIDIFAVEVEDTSCFSEECTPAVTATIPHCVEMVIQELNRAAQKK